METQVTTPLNMSKQEVSGESKPMVSEDERSNGVHQTQLQMSKPVANDRHKKQNESTSNNNQQQSEIVTALNEALLSGKDYSCGLCSARPAWLQKFANKKAFLAIFCLTSVLQGMYYTYFVSVLTTIEKLYQIQSKTTGMIMSATEIGQIGGALLLTYYGGHGHRPKWIACGMLIFAFASILCSTPHYLFGSNVGHRSKSVAHSELTQHTSDVAKNLCQKPKSFLLSNTSSSLFDVSHLIDDKTYTGENANASIFSKAKKSLDGNEVRSQSLSLSSKCDFPDRVDAQSKITHTVLTIFFISLLLIGIGSTAVNTLGIPYIDDNVAPKESPLYFGITIGVRIFGPVCGFLLGSICTSVYVDFPFGFSDLSPDDVDWIGAWWLGVFIVGVSLIITSLPMMAFPRKLPQPDPSSYCHQQQQNSILEQQKLLTNGASSPDQVKIEPNSVQLSPVKKNPKPSLKGFPSSMKRLLKNDVLLCRTASSVLHILPIAGLYTFLPKYLESQFQLTATKANMISGIAGILVMGIGIFASGSFMRKYKPDARFVARWIALSALLYALGMVILMFLGCPLNKFVGLNAGSEHFTSNGHQSCSDSCECPKGEFSPICTSEGVTYVSPCLAGCAEVKSSNQTGSERFTFYNCKCLDPSTTAKNGYCPLECDNLVWYILIFSLFVLIHSTSEVGSMLLTLRCVDPQDKAMALGLISFAIGLFGNVPCPIIYGAVVDSACLFWEDNCGEPGACRVYDTVKFRQVFHGVTAVIMLAAFFVDAIVWYKASSIQFHEDENSKENLEGQHAKPRGSETIL